MSGKFELSREQKQAIDITKNIAVSAGAGSGKTRVLTSRFLRLLEEGFKVEEIAAITFTEKAALEMKQRIRRAIIEKISELKESEKLLWTSHLDRLSRANINTIHGFCSTIIKENAPYLGIDFNFGVMTEIEQTLIIREGAESARINLFSKPEYSALIEKITRIYGAKYLTDSFIKEVHEIGEGLMEEGEDLLKLIDGAQPSSLEKLIYETAYEINRYYEEYKQSRDILDFGDLEHLALRVLEVEEYRKRYRERFKTLLVDEFQDTNDVQRKIIYHLVADENGFLIPAKLFIVGDFKQSIYGFRGTDYKIFKKVSEDIGEEGQVSLSTCYRSENEIIEGINSLFNALIKDYEPLQCPRESEASEKRIKVLTWNKVKDDKKSPIGEVKNLLQGKSSSYESLDEALEDLKASFKRLTPGENRGGLGTVKAIKLLRDKGLEFKDICILVRSKSAIPEIEEELKKRRVPYCIIGGRGFYQRPEVDEVMNLYRVIIKGFDHEFTYEDNCSFIKALRSPYLEIADTTILKISIEKEEGKHPNLYRAIEYVIDAMEDSTEKERLVFAYDTLGKLNRLKDRLSVLQILKQIIKEFKVYETLLTGEEGVQRVRNIEKLMYEAGRFDEQELFTQEQFLSYMKEINETSTGDSEAALDTEDSEAIKIMTIHQSKGLEFKGVIVPKIQGDLLSVSKRSMPKILLRSGAVLQAKDLETGEENAEYKDYCTEKYSAEIDEYTRLLYVAMTRAEEYVILTGEDDGKPAEEAEGDEARVKNLNTFLKQIKYALQVRGADDSLIEFINPEDLADLEKVEECKEDSVVNGEAIEKRIGFASQAKPSAKVSATRYMHHEKCPRKFYIEGVLRVKGSEYLEREIDDDIPAYGGVGAAELGTAVHGAIEAMNEGLSQEAALEIVGETLGGKSMGRVRKHVASYMALEKERGVVNRVRSFNEMEYNLAPLKDRSLTIQGFIDRLEVVEREGRLIGVVTDYKTNYIDSPGRKQSLIETYNLQLQTYGKAIKDLLYMDGIKIEDVILQIYFLDLPERVEIPYDEGQAMEIAEKMDTVFSRNLNQLSAVDFPKRVSEDCKRCEYCGVCIE